MGWEVSNLSGTARTEFKTSTGRINNIYFIASYALFIGT